MIKVVFFGTPEFVLPIPQALLEAGDWTLSAVVTNPDKPIGRKQTLIPSPVKKWAIEHKIKIIDSSSIVRIIKQVRTIKPTVGVLAAYGKIIPKELIDIFPKGILVIHPSLLPKYRGASPVQAAILAGDKEAGVSIIKMDEKMDHGPIISQFTEPIKPDDTSESLYSRLFQETAKVLVTILPAWVEGRIEPREQNHPEATFTRLLEKDDGFIPPGIIASKRGETSKCKLGPYDLEPTPENLERFIRAMSPWPGAYTKVKLKIKNEKLTKRLKILKAHLETGKLVLDLVQLEGKKPVSWKQFQEGYPEAKLI